MPARAPDPDRVSRVLATLTQLEREIVELRYIQRLDATERIREALTRLAEVRSPDELIARAPRELGSSTRLDRVLISRVRGGAMTPSAVWRRDGDHELRELASVTVPLAYPAVEAEVSERQDTAIVDLGVDRARPVKVLADLLGWRSYVVAAVVLHGETVGLLHADLRSGDRSVAEFDRALVGLFASGLESVLERAVLEQTLQRHRQALGSVARWLDERLGAAAPPAGEPPAARPQDPPPATIADPLTPREVEVLRLLAGGLTNRGVGERLGISEGTVKYHVKNILRKLRAASRADAVARYLRLAPAEGAS